MFLKSQKICLLSLKKQKMLHLSDNKAHAIVSTTQVLKGLNIKLRLKWNIQY